MNEKDMYEKLLKEAKEEFAVLDNLINSDTKLDSRIDEIILESRHRMALLKIQTYKAKLEASSCI